MTDRLDEDRYHTLTRRERDHLLAAALVAADENDGKYPTKSAVNNATGQLTASRPSHVGTSNALESLASNGLINLIPDHPDDRSTGVRVTSDGRETLRQSGERLFAAADG